MTRNEELLTVTDENEEKLRSLVEKAKTYAPELFQRHYKITPEEFEKREYARTFGYGVFEDGVIEGCIGAALDLDCNDEKLSSLILNMRAELKNKEGERIEKKDDESKNEYSMRQIIIARKDLDMSAGKLASQCCHASEAFLAHIIENGQCICCMVMSITPSMKCWFRNIRNRCVNISEQFMALKKKFLFPVR